MTNANAQMATEWCLTRTPYGKGVIGCLIKSQGSTREAAAPEDTTATESGNIQCMIEEGETGAGTTNVMTMVAEGDGSDSNYNGSGLARIMGYETWITCMQTPWLGFMVPQIYGSEASWKRLRFPISSKGLSSFPHTLQKWHTSLYYSNSEWKFPRVFDEIVDFLKSIAASLLLDPSLLSQGLLVGFSIKVLALRVVVNKPHHSATLFLRVNNLKPLSDVRLGKSLRGS